MKDSQSVIEVKIIIGRFLLKHMYNAPIPWIFFFLFAYKYIYIYLVWILNWFLNIQTSIHITQ